MQLDYKRVKLRLNGIFSYGFLHTGLYLKCNFHPSGRVECGQLFTFSIYTCIYLHEWLFPIFIFILLTFDEYQRTISSLVSNPTAQSCPQVPSSVWWSLWWCLGGCVSLTSWEVGRLCFTCSVGWVWCGGWLGSSSFLTVPPNTPGSRPKRGTTYFSTVTSKQRLVLSSRQCYIRLYIMLFNNHIHIVLFSLQPKSR